MFQQPGTLHTSVRLILRGHQGKGLEKVLRKWRPVIKNLPSVWMNFRAVAVKSSRQQREASKLVQETMLDTCRHLVVNCDVLPVKERKKKNPFFASIAIIFQKLPVFVSGFHSSHILTGWKDSGWELFVTQP